MDKTKPWPWERKGAKIDKWTKHEIFNYLSKKLHAKGITRDSLSTDLVNFLAVHHWRQMHAIDALHHGEDEVLGGKADTILSDASKSIIAAYRALGVYPYGKVAELPKEDEEDLK